MEIVLGILLGLCGIILLIFSNNTFYCHKLPATIKRSFWYQFKQYISKLFHKNEKT